MICCGRYDVGGGGACGQSSKLIFEIETKN
jgi:hypothetical protein